MHTRVRSRLIVTGLLICLGAARPVFSEGFIWPDIGVLTTRNGLSNNGAFSMLQDSRGFIWIATNYGLNRFDGYEFKVYSYDMADSNSISPGWYWGILEDSYGIIWISSSTQGFYSFDPVSEKFTRYAQLPGDIQSLSGDISDANMARDDSGMLWIPSSYALNRFDPAQKKFTAFSLAKPGTNENESGHIAFICTDEDANIWAVTAGNVLERFDPRVKHVTARYRIGDGMPGDKRWPMLNTVTRGQNGNIWIGSDRNGLYRYNTRSNTWKQFTPEAGNPWSLHDSSIFICSEDVAGNALVAPTGEGIYYYEASTERFHYHALPDAGIISLLRDRSGKMWMACSATGIYSTDPPLKRISCIRRENKEGLASNYMIGMYRSRNGELFFNGSNGVFTYDTQKKKLAPFRIIDNGENVFDGNITWMIRQDRQGTFWFCTLYGLFSYDEKTGEHHCYRHREGDSTSLSAPSATSICQDSKGRYWVTTFGGGLDRFDPVTGKFHAFQSTPANRSLSTNFLQGMYAVSDDIYIGSWYGGLIRFDPDEETFHIYHHKVSDSTTISCDIPWPLLKDAYGTVWVGTVGGGLNAFQPSTGRFRSFTMRDGLPSNAVVSLVFDDEGYAWLGTYHGLSRCRLPKNPFDPACRIQFRNYDTNDGLPSNDLVYLGAYKDPDGTLYFTTSTAGIFSFRPGDLEDNRYVPPVYITSFRLMNRPVRQLDSGSVLSKAIDFTRDIHLDYRQNMISFTFAALNFIHPEKNQYAYQLEGYDKDWIYTDATRRFATYTNLDPGDYVFRVKGSNNDGLWNEHAASIRIFIAPPFWKALWFRILFVLAVLAAVVAFYRYRIGQILLLQRIRNKIAADLHDDIGSTLNSISVFSEVARRDASRRDHALAMIGESSRKILESMSDIVWSINPLNDSFDKIIFRMRSLTYNLMKARKIECTFHSDDSLSGITLSMEKRKNFYLIFKEALNNLVKYSQASRASVQLSHLHGSIACIVRDNGVGFSIAGDYTGNGIRNMKQRAEEIGARLLIESSPGTGTCVELILTL